MGQASALVLSFSLGLLGLCGCTSKEADPLDTLHLSSPSRINTLDPIHADDPQSSSEVAKAYEGLLQYHYLKRPYVLEPALAESLPEVSSDGLTYVFKLKKGTLFHDDPCFIATGGKGRELVAQDFVYSVKRLADPASGSPFWPLLEGRIVGLDDWRRVIAHSGRAAFDARVKGVEALDRYTVKIRWTARSPRTPYLFAMSALAVVPREAVERYGDKLARHPVGTGPFRLEDYNPSDRVSWVRNPTYRDATYPKDGESGDAAEGLLADASKLLPLADKVVVHVIPDERARAERVASGALHLASVSSSEGLAQLNAQEARVYRTLSSELEYLVFELPEALKKSRSLQQAIRWSLESGVESVDSVRASSPIPPFLAGHLPPAKPPEFARAKEQLKGLGSFGLVAPQVSRELVERVTGSLRELGIQVDLGAAKNSLTGHVIRADYPDAHAMLKEFYGKGAAHGEFDRLFEKAEQLPDGAARTQIYRKLAQLIVERTPWAYGAHKIQYDLANRRLGNYKPHLYGGDQAKYYRVRR